jgi:hypothetical protein
MGGDRALRWANSNNRRWPVVRVSGRGSGMRRVRQAGGRRRDVHVRLSEAEYAAVAARAAGARMTPASYLAAAGCEDRAGAGGQGWSLAQRRALAAELFGAGTMLRRAGENLNRLTRIAQAQGALPAEVPAAAAALSRHLARCQAVAVALDPRIGDDGVGDDGGQGEWAATDPTR